MIWNSQIKLSGEFDKVDQVLWMKVVAYQMKFFWPNIFHLFFYFYVARELPLEFAAEISQMLFFLLFCRALNERQRAIMEEFAQEEVVNGDYMDGEVNL